MGYNAPIEKHFPRAEGPLARGVFNTVVSSRQGGRRLCSLLAARCPQHCRTQQSSHFLDSPGVPSPGCLLPPTSPVPTQTIGLANHLHCPKRSLCVHSEKPSLTPKSAAVLVLSLVLNPYYPISQSVFSAVTFPSSVSASSAEKQVSLIFASPDLPQGPAQSPGPMNIC